MLHSVALTTVLVWFLIASPTTAQTTTKPVKLTVITSAGSKVVLQERKFSADGRFTHVGIDSVKADPTGRALFSFTPKTASVYVVNDFVLIAEGGESYQVDLIRKTRQIPPAQTELRELLTAREKTGALIEQAKTEKDTVQLKSLKKQTDSLQSIFEQQVVRFLKNYGKSWVGVYGLLYAVPTNYLALLTHDQKQFDQCILPAYDYAGKLLKQGPNLIAEYAQFQIQLVNHVDPGSFGAYELLFKPHKIAFPPVLFSTTDNKEFTLADYTGKTIVMLYDCYINTWALKEVESLRQKGDVVFILVDITKKPTLNRSDKTDVIYANPKQVYTGICQHSYVIDKHGTLVYGGVGLKRDFTKIIAVVNELK